MKKHSKRSLLAAGGLAIAAAMLAISGSRPATGQNMPGEVPGLPVAPPAPGPIGSLPPEAVATTATNSVPAGDDYALTIYSTADPATFDPETSAEMLARYPNYEQYRLPGYGVVRDTREIDLVAGDNTVRFADVASGIDPTSVMFKSLTAPGGTNVLEQNYEFDLVSPDKLLQKYVGRDVIINRKQPPLPGEQTRSVETIEGKLLSYDGQNFVVQTDNRQLPVEIVPRNADISEIKLFKLQTGLITKPTLVWKIAAKDAGRNKAQVTYQTSNLTWRADYRLLLNKDDTAADLGAWVSIVNESGSSYPDAKLKLVAGDVHRVNPQPEYAQRAAPEMTASAAGTGFAEKSFFEYHMYTLGRPTSLANNSTKQIELFPTRTGVQVEKTYVYYGLPQNVRYWFTPSPVEDRELGTQSNKSVDIYILLQNTEKNGLGIPLPAGRVRVYKTDEADQTEEFIGEDVIQHTPKDEQLMVRVGSAFDIVGERKQTDFTLKVSSHYMTETIEITLRNHKKEAANVIVKENLYRWVDWEITKCSDKYDKVDSRTIHIPVTVPANGEKTVEYTVKYTW